MALNEQTMAVETRTDAGSAACRRLRRTGRIPAVIYGGQSDPASVSIDARQFGRIWGHSSLLQVAVDNSDQRYVLINEVQVDPLTDNVLHVDFQEVRMDQKIHTTVPLTITGEAPGASEGGIVESQMREVEIECLPSDLPDTIEVDISALGVGDHINVSDLTLPAGVELVDVEDDTMVVHVVIPQVIEREEEEEPEELVEGEEAVAGEEAAEGEAGADAAAGDGEAEGGDEAASD